MFQKLSNTHYNLENDTINPETINLITEPNIFSTPNFNTLNPNEYKIEDTPMINDIFFLNKFPLIPKNKPNDEFKKKKSNQKKEKKINNQLLNQNNIGLIKIYNDNHTQSTDCFENEKSKINIFSKKRLGRKRKNDTTIGKHDKYSEDNLRIKIKNFVINYALQFINEKIKNIYQGNIGNGMNKKQLLSISKECKYDTSIESNKNLLYKSLGEIFSGDISTKFNIKYPEYNKHVIQRLLNEKDENKRLALKRLFDIQFLQCIETFSGNNDYEELKGFKQFKDIKENLKDDEQVYIEILENYAKNYENNIKDKKGRKSNKEIEKEKEKDKEKKKEKKKCIKK